jgi:hypothetical protein
MTVCKRYSRIPLIKGNNYRKGDVLIGLAGNEQMAAIYYDPPRDELYAFFDENSPDWENVYQNGVLRFSLHSTASLEETPPWERTKVRHVFLRRKGQSSDYEYLGTSIDETRAPPGSSDWKEYKII